MKKLIRRTFPENIKFGFGYGSGVFQQLNQKKEEKMIDFIFVVEDSISFHKENLKLNSNHYSFISKLFGPKFINYIQRNIGGKIYYNTFIKLKLDEQEEEEIGRKEILIKYGIIEKIDLQNDLKNWNNFYVSGRLQKPVLILFENKNDLEFKKSLNLNLKNSFLFSLFRLLENEMTNEFTLINLFENICKLSYEGDARIENKNKVQNIVKGNFKSFYDLYSKFFENYIELNKKTNEKIEKENLKFKILKNKNEILNEITIENIDSKNLKTIVNKTSKSQALKV
eukprot:gene1583-12708_t